jgi:hypothetical protein
LPLTLGLALLRAIMESVCVMSDNSIDKDMTTFRGRLFGIAFAVDAPTGLTLEFQFETNRSYYSRYVGACSEHRRRSQGSWPNSQEPCRSVTSSDGIVSAAGPICWKRLQNSQVHSCARVEVTAYTAGFSLGSGSKGMVNSARHPPS